MAHLHITNGQQTNYWENLGQKLKTGVEIAGAIKGIWDVGRTIYGGVQALAPLAGAALAVL
jgi:hypothetical protein